MILFKKYYVENERRKLANKEGKFLQLYGSNVNKYDILSHVGYSYNI